MERLMFPIFPRRVAGFVVSFIAAITLTACSVLPEREQLTLYKLPSQASTTGTGAAAQTTASLPISVRVVEPSSTRPIGTMKILVLPDGNQVSAYSGVRWTDPAPVLLRDKIASTLRTDGRFQSVTTELGTLQVDLEVGGDLGAFQVEYRNGHPEVHVLFNGIISRPGVNRIVASHRFEAVQSVQGKEVPQVVDAFGLATDRIATDVARWVEGYVH